MSTPTITADSFLKTKLSLLVTILGGVITLTYTYVTGVNDVNNHFTRIETQITNQNNQILMQITQQHKDCIEMYNRTWWIGDQGVYVDMMHGSNNPSVSSVLRASGHMKGGQQLMESNEQ
jgi:hypothetical protein